MASKCGMDEGHTYPVGSLAVSKVTSPKEEKYLALLVSSPPRKLSIFMSLGNSEIRNLTLIVSPLHKTVYVVA